jgi:bifunctional ADP-heptose synthase (sugar kinase/adenylyltransferase)
MDTRNKILTAEGARALAGPLAVVTGYFDVLGAGHARELEAIRGRIGETTLLALVRPFAGEVFCIDARARMVAALRVVDYVLAADEVQAEALLEALRPRTVIHMEADDARRYREIAERIRRAQAQGGPPAEPTGC